MSQKPETRFTQLVHSKLDPKVFRLKMSSSLRSGDPDLYYEGSRSILWVEYKWIPELWALDKTHSAICSTKSWVSQYQWLCRAHNNNVQTAVIIGIGSGRTAQAYILRYPFNFSFYADKPIPIQDVRNWIAAQVL